MSGKSKKCGKTCKVMSDAVTRVSGGELLWRGVLYFVLGVLLFFRPLWTTAVLTIAIGILIMLDAVSQLIRYLRCRAGSKWRIGWFVLLFLLGAGTVWMPLAADCLWVVALGVWQILGGVEELSSGGASRWNIFSGVLSLLLGVLFVVAPFAGLLSLIWLLGALMIIGGAAAVVSGLGLRRAGVSAE